MIIKEKAYCLNLDKIDDGFLLSEIIVHAPTRNKAKYMMLDKIFFSGYTVNEEDICYTNIPLIRAKMHDKVMLDNKVVRRWEYERAISS